MTTDIKDSAFRAYEEYILKGKNIEEGLKSLVEGSDSYNYLKCIDLLAKKGANMTKDENFFVRKYITHSTTTESRKIALRCDFLDYDKATTPEAKQKILTKIATNYLGLSFFHQRPNDLGNKTTELGKEEKKEEAKPLLDQLDMEIELNKLYNRETSVGDYDKQILLKVDLEKLRKEDFISLLHSLNEDILMLDSSIFYKTYAKLLADEQKTKKYLAVDPSILRNMTIEQMEKLRACLPGLNEEPTFSGIYTSKKFSKELSEEENSNLSYTEKRKNLIKMYEYAKTLPYKLQGLKSSLLLEILENGLKLDLYEESYFMEYIQLPARENFVTKKVAPEVGQWNDCIKNVQSSHNKKGYSSELVLKDKELLTKYLEYFFANGAKIDKFKEFLDLRFLVAVWEDTMLTTGKEVEITVENASRLEKLATDVNINIGEQNKDVFEIGEEVSLWIELKNVPTLFIKVFEINSENYYRKSMAPFRTDINLDGLIASVERTQDYKQSPKIRYKEQLKFPELKGKMGLYVIELIGNGKSSRAVLKIGTLSVINRPTIAGHLCYILDGERKVCAQETTGIWMENQFYKANVGKNGRIVVPYMPSGGNKIIKAILLHQGLAQLVDFNRMEEIYTLECGFFLLPESMIMGQEATIAIRPQLLVNGRAADNKLLKKITCVLSTSKYIDNIPCTKTFSDLVLADNNELLIKFQVAANIKDMRITFSAEVKNVSKDKTESLNANHNFIFSTHADDYSIGELFLKIAKDHSYELHLLGKNGEPIANASVAFSFSFLKIFYSISKQETTNEKGIIKLGKLQGVKQVSASLSQSSGKVSIGKTWNLPTESLMQYPVCIDIIEDEEIILPIAGEYENTPLYLRSYDKVMTIANYSKAIKQTKDKDSLFGIVKISGLKSGTYTLKGIGSHRITIRVHKGIYWPENPSYILKQYSLLENTEKQGFIKIKDVRFEEGKDKKELLKIKVEAATLDQSRVHVLFFNYFPEDLNELSLRLLARDKFIGSEYYFQKWNNFYLSNRELSSEFRYCFDRRHEPRFTGNTLDKPKLLLKRTLLQSTHAQQEAVYAGTAYNYQQESQRVREQELLRDDDYMCCNQEIAPAAEYKRSMVKSDECGVGYNDFLPNSRGDNIPVFQNFLGQKPIALYNLIANKDGTVLVEVDEKYKEQYSCVLILAVDKNSLAHYLYPLSGTKIDKRDLSLAKPLESEKAFSEMRTAKCIEKYGTYIIEDFVSTELQNIDSLEKVLLILKEINKLSNGQNTGLEMCEKFIAWEKMNEEDKNKAMSKFTSHELHLFIRKKDPNYFNSVVKGYLTNKMEKSFIDYYLLDDSDELIKYAEKLELLDNLNPLEKALLVEFIAQNGKKDIALVIANRIRNSLLKYQEAIANKNRIFDTVLSLGSLKINKDGISYFY